jgi:hypothetical protein
VPANLEKFADLRDMWNMDQGTRQAIREHKKQEEDEEEEEPKE